MQHALKDWRHGGIKGVWINIPAEKSELVPVAIKHGFQFHHAERAYVMLTRWLPDTENTLPPNASHQVLHCLAPLLSMTYADS